MRVGMNERSIIAIILLRTAVVENTVAFCYANASLAATLLLRKFM